MHYFQSEIEPKIGDKIATGNFGDCRIVGILDGELECKNIWTGEIGFFFADDCDLID